MDFYKLWLGLLSVLGRWFCCCWLFVCCCSHCGGLWLFCVALCPFWCCSRLYGEGGGCLLCLVCLPGVSWWLGGSSSRCRGVVCGLWLWYFLIMLTIFDQNYWRNAFFSVQTFYHFPSHFCPYLASFVLTWSTT